MCGAGVTVSASVPLPAPPSVHSYASSDEAGVVRARSSGKITAMQIRCFSELTCFSGHLRWLYHHHHGCVIFIVVIYVRLTVHSFSHHRHPLAQNSVAFKALIKTVQFVKNFLFQFQLYYNPLVCLSFCLTILCFVITVSLWLPDPPFIWKSLNILDQDVLRARSLPDTHHYSDTV